ncbi:Dam family site-specific DNA-(adenine-N6)-methyltransferase [Serratia fonticola]|uniref:Dam family site-specific DNA-(adenine-N6)-methyltransferase n=1 Tax=Serratia fonticola TaxID=47917 RepID=UPI0015C66F25|nr:Dam family site-specific DNA-(adenine-N6)-methyltransferase [Serratia fonticola]NXZ86275.1 Dam family site-specific DNA-(adenine-N6)-methyltransferase [Serratia fonticola]
MNIINTPLKWAGSKTRVMESLSTHLPKGNRLVEPFVGSGAVFMNTDYDQYLLADINGDLINLYNIIMCQTEKFIRVTKEYFSHLQSERDYYAVRNDFNLGEDDFYKAVMFLYLNRHCYNGLSRYNQKGEFNVPWGRRDKVYFPEDEIRQFSAKANDKNAVFICCDFKEALAMTVAGDAIYCDPPYAASFTQYHTAGFNQDDQHRLVTELRAAARRGCNVAVSNDYTLESVALYPGFVHHTITAPRSMSCKADGRQSVQELVATLGGCNGL